MAKNPEEVKKVLREIESIYRRIGEANPFQNFKTEAFENVESAVKVLNEGLETGKNKLADLVGDAGELISSFRAIATEVSSGNKELSTSLKSINSLTSIASKMQSDQAGINGLRKKDLETIQKQFKAEKLNLENNRESLVNRARELALKRKSQKLTPGETKELERVRAAHKATVGLIKDEDSAMAELNRKIKKRLKREEKIGEVMGLGGAAIEATSAA